MLAREQTEFGYQPLNSGIMDEPRTPKQIGEIRIPLPEKYSAKAISGDSGIIDSLMHMFGVIDRLVTPVRISEVFEGFATGRSGVGTINTELSHHAYLSFLYYLGIGGVALLDEHLYRVEQRRKDNEKQNLYKLLFKHPASVNNDEPIPDDALETMNQMRWEQIVNNINNYLEQELLANKAFKERYSRIFIDAKTKTLVFQRHASAAKEPEILKSKVLGSIWEYGVKPFYRAGGFAGFAFWLIWMTATATTGIELEGIFGMAPWVGVGVPAGFGLMHLGLYYYNAYKHGGFEKARQHAETVTDFDIILKTLKQRQHDQEIEYIKNRNHELDAELKKRKLSVDPLPRPNKNLVIKTPDGMLEQPLIKGAFTVVSNSAAYWGGATSYSWYIKVLIETAYIGVLSAPLIGTAVGGAILGLSCVFGMHNGYKRYKEAKTLKEDLISLQQKPGHISVPLETFENHYKMRLAYLEQLKSQMQVYKKNHKNSKYPVEIPGSFDISGKDSESQKPKSFIDKMYDVGIAIKNHPIIDAFDMNLIGIFVGRVIFTSVSPFLLAPLLPVALTGPIGIAAIAVVGLAFFAMKWYEKIQIKKEQRMKELPGKLEAVEKNIEDAELIVNDLRMSERLTTDDTKRAVHKQLLDKTPPLNGRESYKLFASKNDEKRNEEEHKPPLRIPEALMPDTTTFQPLPCKVLFGCGVR